MRKTFEEVCAPYSGLVYRHCLHMLQNPQDAEDAAQEAMLRAFRSFSSFNGRAPGGWLYRIAHNTCLDRLRVKKTAVSLEEIREAGFEPADHSPTPEESYLRSSRRDQLREALNALPERDQLLLELFYGEGLRYEEIARAAGIPLGTVKSRLNRVKESLRGLLAEESL